MGHPSACWVFATSLGKLSETGGAKTDAAHSGIPHPPPPQRRKVNKLT